MKKEIRLFRFDITESKQVTPINTWDDDQFMQEANKQGYMSISLDHFEQEFNKFSGDMDNDVIRFIEIELPMKTRLELFKEYLTDEQLIKAIKNTEEEIFHIKTENIRQALTGAFSFTNSPEGIKYWASVVDKFI